MDPARAPWPLPADDPAPELPRRVVVDRAPVLTTALGPLPDWMLRRLTQVLDERCDELTANVLHSRDGGGCAIGLLLEVLYPDDYTGLSRRRRRRLAKAQTIYCARPELARRHPTLAHIELVFDTAVERAREEDPDRDDRELATAAGLWIAAQGHAECELRRVEGRQVRARAPWDVSPEPSPARQRSVPPWGLPEDWAPEPPSPRQPSVPPWGLPEDWAPAPTAPAPVFA